MKTLLVVSFKSPYNKKVEPHELKPPLHMLHRAEPSEAYPTTLFQSFEGYPLHIHPRSERPCLHAEVRYGTQAWLSA